MKVFLGFILLVSSLFANEYYAKLEPFESYSVKSSVSGKVIFSNEKLEGNIAKNDLVIEIDSVVNKIDLEQSLKKLEIM